MTVSLNATSLFNSSVTPTAPLIEGSAASSLSASGFDTTTSVTGRYGMRVTFPSALDFTSFDWVSFHINSTIYDPQASTDTIANGGWRIVFIDGSGNYAGFNIYGSGVPNYNPANGGFQDGFFVAYAQADNTWFISKARTPDISSGTVDWSNIVASELTVKTTAGARKQATLSRMAKRTSISFTGTETLLSIRTAAAAATTAINAYRLIQRTPYYQFGASGIVYTSSLGLLVGDGSTTTNWTDSTFLLGFENTYDKSPAYRSTGPWIQLDDSNTRLLKVNQSASDVLALSDFSIASAAWWQWELTGSGTASCARGQFWRFNSFKAGHGTYTDCTWDGGEAAVEITASTTVTRGTVRNGVGHGIKITGAAGNYAALDIDFSDNSTYDIELGSGGAGNYVLTGIAVIGAYTLKIRNDHASNAITVEIPGGITYSTSTAGGTISVTAPAVYQSVTISGATAGSRIQIYDTTSSTELYNGTPTFPYTWTDSVGAAADRTIRLRVSYVSGVTAKEFIEANIGTCGQTSGTAAVSYLVNQSEDTTYNSNAIDGPAIYATSGITFTDAATDLVNCNIAGGSGTYPTIYACFAYWISTATGIADDFAYIYAPDPANYWLSGMKIRNVSATDLTITGGYGRDSSTGFSKDIIDTAGSIGNVFLAPDHVVPYQTTGTYAITGDISTVLTAVGNVPAGVLSAAATTPIAANIKKVADTTVAGSGTTSDPWGPV